MGDHEYSVTSDVTQPDVFARAMLLLERSHCTSTGASEFGELYMPRGVLSIDKAGIGRGSASKVQTSRGAGSIHGAAIPCI